MLMQASRKPFNERAKIQLNHLKTLNRRYATAQQRWADYFKQMKFQIAELKKAETKLSGEGRKQESAVLKSQLRELEETLEQARKAFAKKK